MADDTDDKTYVAESLRSYGVSDLNETDAVYRMARFWHGDARETERMVVWTVRGYHGGGQWRIDADEVLRETWYEVPREAFEDLLDAAGAIDYAVEDVRIDNEIDPRDA